MIIFLLNIVIGLAILLLISYPASEIKRIKDVSLFLFYLIFIISLFLLNNTISVSYFYESFNYSLISFPNFVLNYSYVVDGLSIFFILLTTFLFVF